MLLSVVISTYNRHQHLKTMLKSFQKSIILPNEIIIIDQSDEVNNEIINEIKSFNLNINYITCQKKGLSNARNIGWHSSKGDIISFTDDDVIVDQHWIESIINSFKKYPNAGIVSGKIIARYEEKNIDWKIPDRWKYLLPHCDFGNQIMKYSKNCLPSGANFSIKRDLLERFNGFNEMLGINADNKIQIFGEDTDLALKVRKSGYDLIYNPHCIVFHPVPISRQNQQWLEKRLFSEGITKMYLKSNVFSCLYEFVKNLLLIMVLKFRSNQNILTDGKISFSKGKLYFIINTFLHKSITN